MLVLIPSSSYAAGETTKNITAEAWINQSQDIVTIKIVSGWTKYMTLATSDITEIIDIIASNTGLNHSKVKQILIIHDNAMGKTTKNITDEDFSCVTVSGIAVGEKYPCTAKSITAEAWIDKYQNTSKIEIVTDGDKRQYTVPTSDIANILDFVAGKTGLTQNQIKSILIIHDVGETTKSIADKALTDRPQNISEISNPETIDIKGFGDVVAKLTFDRDVVGIKIAHASLSDSKYVAQFHFGSTGDTTFQIEVFDEFFDREFNGKTVPYWLNPNADPEMIWTEIGATASSTLFQLDTYRGFESKWVTIRAPAIDITPNLPIDFDDIDVQTFSEERFCGRLLTQFDNVITGSKNNDVLIGTIQSDLIIGDDGDDIIYPSLGDDCVLAGDGDDIVVDYQGKDYIIGGNGEDTIKAGYAEPDIIIGGNGNDILEIIDQGGMIDGGSGDDIIYFGSYGNNETIVAWGGNGNDRFIMGSNDFGLVFVDAGQGADECYLEDEETEGYATSTWSIINCEQMQMDPSDFSEVEY